MSVKRSCTEVRSNEVCVVYVCADYVRIVCMRVYVRVCVQKSDQTR